MSKMENKNITQDELDKLNKKFAESGWLDIVTQAANKVLEEKELEDE